jgi:hypothetical protein
MLAIGVLVPLDQGRIGKSWLHAKALRELARYESDLEAAKLILI